MGVRVRVCVETEDYEPDRFRGSKVYVGNGVLDPNWYGPREALIIPGLPELLRHLAEQIESAMTTGPDEGWLSDDLVAAVEHVTAETDLDQPDVPPPWRCERCGSERWVGWRAGRAMDGLRRYAQCGPCGHVQDLPAGEPR